MKESLPTKRTISHYRILHKLGAGGMGEVYLAEDIHLDRKVAIKFLPAESVADETAKKRLVREARAAAKLDHANICAIHEVGEEDGRSFIVMQYVEGETLASLILRKPLQIREAIDIAVQLADALAEAHSRGIIHRDLKPQNIMLAARGQVKVLDFGLAKVARDIGASASEAETQSLLTEPGMIIGTVPYMSPEQVRGEMVDARSDIFSFGTVLYEMLSGRQPFAAESAAATCSAILTKTPPALARYADVPDELQRIARKCLEKERERRYQTARDLAIDLENVRGQSATAVLTASPADQMTASTAAVITDQSAKQQSPFASRRALSIAGLGVALIVAALAYALLFRGARTAPQPEIKSLAVLPLKFLGQGASDDYLGLGIADTIITKVSQIGGLTVRPTSAVRRYVNQEIDSLEAGRQLKTDSVLDGSVQRSGDRLRVSVNLLRVQDGASLWAESFDLREADLFGIQDEVSRQVVSRLEFKLTSTQEARLAKRYTSNPEAYDYYTKAVYHFSDRQWVTAPRAESDRSIELFKKAIELDPSYALAHAQLGYAYAWTAIVFEDNVALLERAKQQIGTAESLDPQLAEVHVARSFIFWSQYEGWQVAAAIRELRLAQQSDPNVGHFELSNIYAHIGLDEQHDKEIERALEIDPTSSIIKQSWVNDYYLTARPDEGLAADQRLFNRGPIDLYYLEKRMLKEAESLIAQKYQKEPDNPNSRSNRALLLALQGKQKEAEAAVPAIVEKAPQTHRAYHHTTYTIARIYALRGRVEEAVKWLKETAETGMPNYPLFLRDPFLERIRTEPAFIQFMAEMKARWEGNRREFG